MAGWELLASEPTLQVVSPEIVYDAQRVVARATASGVVFSLLVVNTPVAPDRWQDLAARVEQNLDTWAVFWNSNAKQPGVISIGMSQEVDAAGQLRDVALVIVSSTSGRSTSQLTLHAPQFLPTEFAKPVAAARAALDALEAAGPATDESGLTASGVVVDGGG